LILGLFFIGCLEKEEGCLDPRATNLDVTADVSANCRYPALNLRVSHQWIANAGAIDADTTTFRLNQPYLLESADTLVVQNFDLLISDVRVGDAPGLVVLDSALTMDGTFIRDDLSILSPRTVQTTIGQLITFGTFVDLAFDIGYDERWLNVDTTWLRDENSSHPWFSSRFQLDNDVRSVCQFAYLIKDTAGDTVVQRNLRMAGPEVTSIEQALTLNTIRATPVNISLFMDYSAILGNVNLLNADTVAIKNQVLNNIPDAISVLQ